MVLVVDDFPESIDDLLSMLAEQGFVVALALDGEDGVQQASASKPDVIVMDVAMPRVDGLAAARRIKEQPETRHIPVVLFSAHAGPELRAIADQIGCAGVVEKPAGTRDVVELVRTLCAVPQAAISLPS